MTVTLERAHEIASEAHNDVFGFPATFGRIILVENFTEDGLKAELTAIFENLRKGKSCEYAEADIKGLE